MSLRKDSRDQLIHKIEDVLPNLIIKAVTYPPVVSVTPWQGDNEEFNSTGVYPSIEVGKAPRMPAAVFGKPMEIGARTWGREFRYAVYVSTEDVAGVANADEIAWEILEELEESMHDTELVINTVGYRLELLSGEAGSEMLLERHATKALYVQQYRVFDLKSFS